MKRSKLPLWVVAVSVAGQAVSPVHAGHTPVEPQPPIHVPDEVHSPVTNDPLIIPPILSPGQNPVFAGTNAAAAVAVSQGATNSISSAIREIVDFCKGISGSEYNVDCMGDKLGQVASELPTTGDYAEVRAALEVASQDLAKLAKDNASKTLPSGVARQASNPSAASTRPLIPVETASLPDVNAQAEAILDELETTLLRSAANSQTRQSHYQEIAAAVGTNKVLLRSG